MNCVKIHETRKRSLLKALSQRVVEIAATALLLTPFVGEVPTAIGLAVASETLCFGLHFLNERIWNKVDYGRGIK